jgi:hypothetical protein
MVLAEPLTSHPSSFIPINEEGEKRLGGHVFSTNMATDTNIKVGTGPKQNSANTCRGWEEEKTQLTER